MKIAFVLPGRGNSGGVRCTSIAAEMLRNRGHEVRILHAESDFSMLNWVKAARDRILYADMPNFLDQFKGPIASFKELGACHFDENEIIVAVGMIISAQMDVLDSIENPKLQYIHGSTPDRLDRRKKAFSLPIPKIAVATYLKDLVEKEGTGEFLGVIHNGIDPAEYFPSAPESSRDGVGTIYGSHPAKDPKTVIEVLQSLSKLRPDVPLRVFSGDRRPTEISGKIYLRHPTVEQARDIYSRSQVWILASHSEGFPAPVLEAMACGCAVVATDCGGTKDQIVDGENGFLVPVGDMERIINRVLLLLDNPDLRIRIQKSALETARQFTWEKCVDALEATLGRLARQNDRHPTAFGKHQAESRQFQLNRGQLRTSPLISVIIPTFNRSKLLMNALDSVFAQTLKDFEVLVIDDGSTDDTERAVQSYCSRNSLGKKIRYFKQANQGKSVALNVGLDVARGEWTAFLDSDDVWLPSKLQRQMETISVLAGRCEACFTNAEFVNNPNWAKTSSERARQTFVGTYGELIDPALFIATKTHGISVVTMLAKTALCIKVGGFDKNLRVLEDYDFVFRLARKTGFCYVNENLVKVDRTPNRPEGLIELFEVDEIRLQQMQYVYEKWLSSEDPLPERIRQGIYTQLRGVHSEWANYYLKIQDNSRARQAARRALSYRWSAKTAFKLLLTTLAPTFTRELVIKRG